MITAEEVRSITRAVGAHLHELRAGLMDHFSALTRDLASTTYVDETVADAVKDAGDSLDDRIDTRLRDFPTRDEVDDAIETVLAGERVTSTVAMRAYVSDAVSSAVDPLAGTIAETLRGDAKLRGEPGPEGLGLGAPAWAPGVFREGAVVSHHIGQAFRALRDTAEEPVGGCVDWERLGTCGFRMAQPWRDGNSYVPGDLFVRERSLMLQTPTGPVLAVGRGSPGKQGDKGDAGRDGGEIELLELRGAELAVVFRNGDGETRTAKVDLAPLVETITRRVLASLEARA